MSALPGSAAVQEDPVVTVLEAIARATPAKYKDFYKPLTEALEAQDDVDSLVVEEKLQKLMHKADTKKSTELEYLLCMVLKQKKILQPEFEADCSKHLQALAGSKLFSQSNEFIAALSATPYQKNIDMAMSESINKILLEKGLDQGVAIAYMKYLQKAKDFNIDRARDLENMLSSTGYTQDHGLNAKVFILEAIAPVLVNPGSPLLSNQKLIDSMAWLVRADDKELIQNKDLILSFLKNKNNNPALLYNVFLRAASIMAANEVCLRALCDFVKTHGALLDAQYFSGGKNFFAQYDFSNYDDVLQLLWKGSSIQKLVLTGLADNMKCRDVMLVKLADFLDAEKVIIHDSSFGSFCRLCLHNKNALEHKKVKKYFEMVLKSMSSPNAVPDASQINSINAFLSFSPQWDMSYSKVLFPTAIGKKDLRDADARTTIYFEARALLAMKGHESSKAERLEKLLLAGLEQTGSLRPATGLTPLFDPLPVTPEQAPMYRELLMTTDTTLLIVEQVIATRNTYGIKKPLLKDAYKALQKVLGDIQKSADNAARKADKKEAGKEDKREIPQPAEFFVDLEKERLSRYEAVLRELPALF